jgi:hypothetical protein
MKHVSEITAYFFDIGPWGGAAPKGRSECQPALDPGERLCLSILVMKVADELPRLVNPAGWAESRLSTPPG